MMIRAVRLCHHCAIALTEDDVLHYVFECHDCVMIEHDRDAALRRDPERPIPVRRKGVGKAPANSRRDRAA